MLLIALCRSAGIPVVTTGASAGRRDPTAIEVVDLAESSHIGCCRKCAKNCEFVMVFPVEMSVGVPCVVSRERSSTPNHANCQSEEPDYDWIATRVSAPPRL